MGTLKILSYFVVIVILFLAATLFASRNDQTLVIDTVLMGNVSLSAGAGLLASFIIGSLITWLVLLPQLLSLKAARARRTRKLAVKQAELDRIKSEAKA